MMSTEKDRKTSELKFSMMVLSCVSINFQERVEKYEVRARRARRDRRELWDSLVFSLSNFYWRLRMVKYQFINTQSLRSLKRPEKYDNLEYFVERGLAVLKSDGREELLRVKLPPDTHCMGCGTNLGDRTARRCVRLPNQVIWPKEANMACVLELKTNCGEKESELRLKMPHHIAFPSASYAKSMASVLQTKTKSIITCGGDSCNKEAESMYNLSLLLEAHSLYKFIGDSRICHGCSKYSLKTHRCSRCRLERYCSQDCFNVHWRDHRVRCEPYIRPGNWELFAPKKLVGEAKQDHFYECTGIVNRYYDPYIGTAFCD